MYSYEEFTNELETLLQKYFGKDWRYWYDDMPHIIAPNVTISETLEKMYEYYCNERDVKEMGSCNGHQETDAEYAKRIAQLEGKPCNCGQEVKE